MHPPCCGQPSAVWAMERAQAPQSCPTWGRHPARLALTLALAAAPTMVAVGSGFGFDCKTMATSGGREGTARGRVRPQQTATASGAQGQSSRWHGGKRWGGVVQGRVKMPAGMWGWAAECISEMF